MTAQATVQWMDFLEKLPPWWMMFYKRCPVMQVAVNTHKNCQNIIHANGWSYHNQTRPDHLYFYESTGNQANKSRKWNVGNEIRDQWWIQDFPGEGDANRGGGQTYSFAHVSQKLHENEESLAPREASYWPRPRSATSDVTPFCIPFLGYWSRTCWFLQQNIL